MGFGTIWFRFIGGRWPAANIAFLDTGGGTLPANPDLFNIMWDSREPNLENQFIDATEFHGQTTVPPSAEQQIEGASFQAGVFAGQTADFSAGDLTGADGTGAVGGPYNLYESRFNVPPTFPFSPGFCFDGGAGFCPGIFGIPTAFDLYTAFANAISKHASLAAKRQSIARGENIFNTRLFIVNDVERLNNKTGACAAVPGAPNECTATCSTCHNNENVGNDNFLDPKREGIMDNSNNIHNALPPSADFPLFAFYRPSGSIPFFTNQVTSTNCPGGAATCDEFDTTDPGLGLADGECADLGRMKVPVLHSLAARAPYFHGGNVRTCLAS